MSCWYNQIKWLQTRLVEKNKNVKNSLNSSNIKKKHLFDICFSGTPNK